MVKSDVRNPAHAQVAQALHLYMKYMRFHVRSAEKKILNKKKFLTHDSVVIVFLCISVKFQAVWCSFEGVTAIWFSPLDVHIFVKGWKAQPLKIQTADRKSLQNHSKTKTRQKYSQKTMATYISNMSITFISPHFTCNSLKKTDFEVFLPWDHAV